MHNSELDLTLSINRCSDCEAECQAAGRDYSDAQDVTILPSGDRFCMACESQWSPEKRCIEKGKQEILRDIAAGLVPNDVNDFQDLHDYVDANEYGGIDLGVMTIEEANRVQDGLHYWLAAGRPASTCD